MIIQVEGRGTPGALGSPPGKKGTQVGQGAFVATLEESGHALDFHGEIRRSGKEVRAYVAARSNNARGLSKIGDQKRITIGHRCI